MLGSPKLTNKIKENLYTVCRKQIRFAVIVSCEAVFASHETMAYEKVKLLHVACVANTGTRNATHSTHST